jgi:hypothetical protein
MVSLFSEGQEYLRGGMSSCWMNIPAESAHLHDHSDFTNGIHASRLNSIVSDICSAGIRDFNALLQRTPFCAFTFARLWVKFRVAR